MEMVSAVKTGPSFLGTDSVLGILAREILSVRSSAFGQSWSSLVCQFNSHCAWYSGNRENERVCAQGVGGTCDPTVVGAGAGCCGQGQGCGVAVAYAVSAGKMRQLDLAELPRDLAKGSVWGGPHSLPGPPKAAWRRPRPPAPLPCRGRGSAANFRLGTA